MRLQYQVATYIFHLPDSYPGFGTNSYTRSRPARKDATNRNLLRQSFIAYIFRSQSAREQESKSTRVQERKRARARARESKKARKRTRTRKQEREWQNPVPFKENYPPPRTYYSLIGCSPSAQLSSRERQNTWRENCPCTCADYVYHLEHSCQRHLIMANVRAAPNISPFSFNKSNRPPILMRVEIEVKSPVCR